MNEIRALPELEALRAPGGTVRIPPEVDVPLTSRVRRLIDTTAFRRLSSVKQLGLVPLVYPGATHSRFEHSLGVYRMGLLVVDQLSEDERFRAIVSPPEVEQFLVTTLLHDLGHWPYCHPIEDLALPDIPRHEEFCRTHLQSPEVATLLENDWGFSSDEILRLLGETGTTPSERLLSSLLSGPVDVDKLDYLMRDSLHAGVPYGRNFDVERLIKSLRLNRDGDGLALSEKGKTAAELLVFARYVMFSEVYWHHCVRAGTAMLQRAFYRLLPSLDLPSLFQLSDDGMARALEHAAEGSPCVGLVGGLFGPRRILYKRLAQYSYFEERDLYERVARRPYPWLVRLSEEFAALASAAAGEDIAADAILFDAPPVAKEVEFNIDIFFEKTGVYRRFEDVSPVVRALAREQFDDYVKRVRVFAHPSAIEALNGISVRELIVRAANALESDPETHSETSAPS